MSSARIFDLAVYGELNKARAAVVSQLLLGLRERTTLRTALDVACGAGYFSGLLSSLGFEVIGVDGRQENVEDCTQRYPAIRFERFNAEETALRSLGKFDLVLCFGLLYHLENPLMAIRHLEALTRNVLLVEGVIFQGREPIMGLIDELPLDDQGLSYTAFYPTEACLQKMLYRAGFSHVYKFKAMPRFPGYRKSGRLPKVRTMLAASHEPILTDLLEPVSEPRIYVAPWDQRSVAASKGWIQKLVRFMNKPLAEKVNSVKRAIGTQ